ncbi:glycosyltransferase family 2 protein [Flavobacterium caseinilyticum]|uniref:Glycosyltransferase n=1 Tax=Flavobacterium caseinilyticum TaxID=2541732 RepID=A0A4R5AV41_9FLAO|nr:glycosyltransferase family 2 protein [Flavobacterium caseinilyticum]TDD75960.1 glycosyltransferase [Flavobacterium caseinilyticum]
MPKISIITINYNNLEGLKRTVESVVNQTWQEFEYIVIDGGSTDGSAEYIESQASNIDYWVSEPDKGIYNGMNKGIAKATGEYLLFLNSGDHFFSDKVLEQNHKHIANYDLIYFDLQFIEELKSKVVCYPNKLCFSDLLLGSLPHPSTIIKASLFSAIGLYAEQYTIVSDWKFFILALFKYNCTYLKVNQTLSVFYLDGISSDSTQQEILFNEREEVLNSEFKNIIEDLKELNELRRIVIGLRKSRKISLLVRLGLLNKF